MPTTITFSEFPIGTANPVFNITDNIVRTGGGIRSDGANPTSPVLAGSPSSFFPPVSVSFDVPVESVTLDAGYFDNVDSTRILFYGPAGQTLSVFFNAEGDGIETFTYNATDVGIAGVSVVAVRQEDAGFAIDNLIVGDPFDLPLPELQDKQGNAASLETWLGTITNALNSVENGSVGPGDMVDTFGFFAPHPVRVTFTLTAESNPNTVVEYEIDYTTGTHFFEIEDIHGYSEAEDYTLAVTSVVDISAQANAAAQQAGLDLAQNLLKLVAVDMKVLAAEIAAAVQTADDAKEFYKGLGKGLGKAAIFLDVFFRFDNVINAQDPARELFIQTVDFGTGLLASWGGAAGGAAVGAWFAGVGAGIGGPLGGFGAGIIYNFGISSSVQEAAGDFWDATIGAGNKVLENMPDAAISIDPDTGDLVFEGLDNAPVQAEAFDPDWYLDTYPDAADAVATGAVPSAYIHFLTVGASLGYLPADGAAPVDPATLVGNASPDLARLATADSRWGIYQAMEVGDIRGDGLSAEEAAFHAAMVADRTEGTTFDLDADLTALANRRAIDLVHNQGLDPVLQRAVEGDDWGVGNWANGEDFATGAQSVLSSIDGFEAFGLRVYAFVSNATNPDELMAELRSSLLGRQILFDTLHNSVGVAEYGGVWVIVSSPNFTNTPPANEVNDSEVNRIGSSLSETMSLGTWHGDLAGNGGRDNLFGGAGNDTLSGGGDDDSLQGNGGRDQISGNNGNDNIDGGDGADTLAGGIGFDTIMGGAGFDQIAGADGYDEIHGGIGDDQISGNNGFDRLFGDGGNDVITGGLSPDTISGGSGDDTLSGQAGNDLISGDEGDDEIMGNAGADTLSGGDGNDLMTGGINFDEMDGGAGDDTMSGNNGGDTMNGGAGNDILNGNAGHDVLDGGAGDDELHGGIGADEFNFAEGNDTISDFQNNIDSVRIEADLLDEAMPVVADLANYASVVNGNLVLTFATATLTFNNVTDVATILDETQLI